MVTYIDTYNKNGWNYAAYLENCEDNGVEPAGEDSSAFYNWVSDMMELDMDAFFSNLEYSPVASGPVTVRGHLGLWWGRPEIEPRRFECLADAIRACMDGAWDVTIRLDRGVLTVEGHHHDGTNYFTNSWADND